MSLTLSLFGSFHATYSEQAHDAPLTFATNAARALLAYLAVEADRPHAREQLAALFWSDVPQAAAFANLRQTLARLRKALPSAADALLQTTPQTIQLNHEAATVDVVRFEELLAECALHSHSHAHSHADVTRCPECVTRMQHAASLYTGEFLQGLSLEHSQPFEEWVMFKREELHQRALETLHTLARHYEATGAYEAMRHAAAQQLVLEPWHEAAHLQLILALAYSGQRAAALAQFEVCRDALQNELGIEPSNETVAAYARIRVSAEGMASLAGPNAPVPHHNLPEQLTAFVGRERELQKVVSQVQNIAATERLLTLVGPGGMGKTRLALEVARACLDAFPNGVFFVSLASLATSAAIVPAIASALGLSVQGNDLKRALLSTIRTKHLLLILDNFEHIIDGADIATDILQSAPAIQIIATSRERLNVRGERVFNVEGMDYSPGLTLTDAQTSSAVRLFVQSAHRAQPTFRLSKDTLPAVLRICRLVQGMPLGLELAAAWAEALRPDDIAAEIENSPDFLAFDWRDMPERHRSMRAVFQWSWNLLNAAERNIFQRLSVFRGGFMREAAQTVAGASLSSLALLVRKSLLRRGETGRYEIHELLRQFVAEQLRTWPDEQAHTEERHATYYLNFVAVRERRLARHEPRQAIAEIQAEIDNIRKAWATTCVHHDELDRSAFALWQFYLSTGLYAEGELAFGLATKHVQLHKDKQHRQPVQTVLSKLLALQARFLTAAGKSSLALPIAQLAVALGEANGSIEGEAIGHLVLGQALSRMGQHQAARPHLERILQLAQHDRSENLSNDFTTEVCEALFDAEANAYIWMSVISISLDNDYVSARQHCTEALRIARAHGSLRLEMASLVNLANCARATSDYEVSRQDYEQAMQMAHSLGYRWGEGAAQLELSDVVRLLGDYTLARDLTERALVILREIGDYVQISYAYSFFARLCIYLGDYICANEWLEQCWQTIRITENPEGEVIGLWSLALLNQHTGHLAQALEHAEKAWQIAVKSGYRAQQAGSLTILGHVHASLATPAHVSEATRAYEQALNIFAEIENIYQVVEPRAGLAQMDLAQGNLSLALSHVEAILAVQTAHPRAGMDEPFFAYLVCYRVLTAVNDPRAATVLEVACALLQDYAEHIDDEGLRQSFLQNVPTHRELWALRQAEAIRA